MKSGIKPNSNVYAELGSTWRFLSMRDPDSAAHGLGKLFKHVGEDNVLWGTDSIWYGSPQDQIQAFRTFQISQRCARSTAIRPSRRHCVPRCSGSTRRSLTGSPRMRSGNSSARDKVAQSRAEYSEAPNPSFATYGPRSRREFLNLRAWHAGEP